MAGAGAVQSVDRAARVLEILARDGESGVGRIAAELEVHQSTASRLVAALEQHDLVERPWDGGPVRLGAGVLRLAASVRSGLDLTEQAAPVCDRLAEQLGETVNLAVYRDGAAVNLYQAQGTRTVALHDWVGNRTVLHATSSGKMLMAHLSPAERESLLAAPRERFTDRTVTSAAELERELDEARERGWASAVEEFEEGLNAVAAGIRGPDGRVVAALSAAGPAYRLGPEDLSVAASLLIRAGEEISGRLGGRAGSAG